MPPKAVIYHICGQHLCGEALVGYAVGPDTPIMLAPKLILKGGAVKDLVRASAGSPVLNLKGKTFAFAISGTAISGKPFLYLLPQKARGRESGMVPSPPEDLIIFPTTEGDWVLAATTEEDLVLAGAAEEDWTLVPTEEEDWLLVPTTEREM